jgi:hypothetical protein
MTEPTTPERQSRKTILVRALVSVLAFLAFSWVMASLLSLVRPRPFVDALDLVVAATLGAIALAGLAARLRDRTAAGPVLLDCGRAPAWGWVLLPAFFTLLFLLFVALTGGFATSRTLIELVIWSTIEFLITGSSRLQFREHGVWHEANLCRWDKIVSYRWAKDGRLMVKAMVPVTVLHRLLGLPSEHERLVEWVIPVRSQDRPAVEELLRAHCPAQV